MVSRCFSPVLLTCAFALSTATLEACGSSSSDTASSTDTVAGSVAESASSAAATGGSFNDADVTFAQNMIPHHQQAVEMAVIALDDARAASDDVKALAERIQAAQQPEIDLMTGWLTSWGKEVMPAMDGMDHASMSGMAGMMSAEDMASLEVATGEGFDTAWMQMMIAHHEGAVTMAKAVQADGENADVQALAERIVSAQEAEITEMKTALGQ
jgi:uncharacterized protein (DUF305 family)